jgi:hypothetical protein
MIPYLLGIVGGYLIAKATKDNLFVDGGIISEEEYQIKIDTYIKNLSSKELEFWYEEFIECPDSYSYGYIVGEKGNDNETIEICAKITNTEWSKYEPQTWDYPGNPGGLESFDFEIYYGRYFNYNEDKVIELNKEQIKEISKIKNVYDLVKKDLEDKMYRYDSPNEFYDYEPPEFDSDNNKYRFDKGGTINNWFTVKYKLPDGKIGYTTTYSSMGEKYAKSEVLRDFQAEEILEIRKATKSEIDSLEYEKGGETNGIDKETYQKWKRLVNMSKSELKRFYDSEEGKEAGLSPSEAKDFGIDYGRESARWIMKMKDTPVSDWTPTMWKWAKKQISFISRMSGNKGKLYDENGKKTPKHTSLLIWGHNPEK